MIFNSVSLKAIASLLSIVSVVNGHMIMKTPIPYGRGSISNSPLDPSGSDFPCKNIFDMTDPTNDVNHMAIGEAQTLSFTGSAVHGGGSCQVSLTTDLKPTKNSKWMVIKSIEGGCPADTAGNLPADPNGSGAATFQYTVPEGISPGQYTIAWTWVNKIGNREFYMNCGRADISAAKKKRYAPTPKPDVSKRATSFPNLFVANLAGVSNSCTTTEGVDIVFPNAGSDVTKSSDGKFGPPVGCSGNTADTPVEQPSGSAGSGSAPSSSAVKSQAQSTAAATATVSTKPGGVFASGAAPQSTVAASASVSSAAATISSAPLAATTTVAGSASTAVVSPLPATSTAAASSGSSNTNGSTTPGSPCSNEGAWSCSANGSSFQRCASGTWSVVMQMAAGTTCSPGTASNIQMNAIVHAKRGAAAAVIHKGSFHHRRSFFA